MKRQAEGSGIEEYNFTSGKIDTSPTLSLSKIGPHLVSIISTITAIFYKWETTITQTPNQQQQTTVGSQSRSGGQEIGPTGQ